MNSIFALAAVSSLSRSARTRAISAVKPSGHTRGQASGRSPSSFAKTDNAGYVLRARSPVSLVAASGHGRLQCRALLYEERSDTFRPMNLMGGDGIEVHTQAFHIDGNLS